MGGKRLHPKAESVLIYSWTELSKSGKEPSAKQVIDAAKRYLTKNKISDVYLPQKRKVQEILAQARIKNEGIPPYERDSQLSWSMATLDKYPLPADSIPIVMQAWRYALINGENFSIRQAKWVSRLFTTPFLHYEYNSNIFTMTKLWLASYEYTKKEEAALISHTQFDTFNSDVRLVFSDIEYLTIWRFKYGEQPFPDPFITSIPYANDGGIMYEVMHPVDYYNAIYNDTIMNDRDKELFQLISEMPSFLTLNLYSNEMMVLYLIWINNIKRKPEWQRITAKEAVNIILKLRDWILNLQSLKYGETGMYNKEIAFKLINKEMIIESGLPIPKEILDYLTKYASKESE
jgi:hypothetical protein